MATVFKVVGIWVNFLTMASSAAFGFGSDSDDCRVRGAARPRWGRWRRRGSGCRRGSR